MTNYSVPDTILTKFADWMAEANALEPNDPNAMSLATVAADGSPTVRIVLMKGYDARGWTFYTNLTSRKAEDLLVSGMGSLLFHWKSLRRQIRLDGAVEQVSDAEADAYFASRPRGSQIGAWASDQSSPLNNREELEGRIAKFAGEFEGGDVPRPPHWSGFRLMPKHVEFWTDQESRLHIRETFTRDRDTGVWSSGLLYP